MKVLIVGGGGREHALAWKLCRDDPGLQVIAAAGNPGIASLARCVPISVDKHKELAHLAEDELVDFTLVGPELPLEGGIVNLFQSRGLPIFGPTREAARIETSKRFAKDLMGPAGMLGDSSLPGPMGDWWSTGFLFSPALTIGGGTSEVLRNVMAERLLGLPHDPAVA